MKKNRNYLLLALLIAVGLVLAACGGGDDNEGTDDGDATGEGGTDFKVGMVTDVGGVDDKSFNQSAWEGLKAFGADNGLEEKKGYNYAQSNEEADYKPNLNSLIRDDYNLVFGVGYKLHDAINEVAEDNPDTLFSIIDDVVEQPNVASITFKEHQGSFLVGVVAAMKTESDTVGFVGGTDSPLINKFEVGFRAGVKAVNPDLNVEVVYAESFADATKGKVIASSMFDKGIDVIYHASGATGNGVFSEAKDRKKNNPDGNFWVIGVDRDQHEEGAVPGTDFNVTLTSMIKRVDVAVQDIATRALNDEFPGGEVVEYGLEDNGIGVAETNEEALTEDILNAVNDYKEQIINGDITVPSTHDELEG
jgi:basic membrane protein A and related proteins